MIHGTPKVPMTPTELDFFSRKPNDCNLENICFAATLAGRCDPSNLKRSLEILSLRHDSLRFRFAATGSGWEKWRDDSPVAVHAALQVINLEDASPQSAEAAIRQTHRSLRNSIDVTRGPIAAAAYYRGYPRGGDSFGLVLSHAVCDGYAFMSFIAELRHIWSALENGAAPTEGLPPPGSASGWADAYRNWAKSSDAAIQWIHWLNTLHNPPTVPCGAVTGSDCTAEEEMTDVLLESDDLHELENRLQERKEFHHVMEVRVLAAWLSALREEWGSDDFLVSRIVNGRKAPFASQHPTIGWLMIYHPLRIRLAADSTATLESARNALAAVPTSGHGFGALRFLSGDPRAKELEENYMECGLLFNYLGGGVVDRHGKDAFFGRAEPGSVLAECVGEQDGTHDGLRWNIYLLAYLLEGKLRVTIDYDRTMISRNTMQRILDRTGSLITEMLRN